MFDVGCLMMTQHLSPSVENGPDLGWKNLFWLFHLFFPFSFFSKGFFFPFFFFILFFLPLKAVDPWRLVVIASDMMYHFQRDPFILGLWWADAVLQWRLASQATAGLQPAIFFWYKHNGTKSGLSEKRCAFNVWVRTNEANVAVL